VLCVESERGGLRELGIGDWRMDAAAAQQFGVERMSGGSLVTSLLLVTRAVRRAKVGVGVGSGYV
jgi:hypothetical protein